MEILEVQTSDTKKMYSENSGIAIIFPSWKLHDILESKTLIDRVQGIAKIETEKSTGVKPVTKASNGSRPLSRLTLMELFRR